MSTPIDPTAPPLLPSPTPAPPDPAPRSGPGTAIRWLLGAIAMSAVAAAAAWLAVEWRMGRELQAAMAEVASLQQALADRDAALAQREQELSREFQAAQQQMAGQVAAVERAAREAALMLQGTDGAQALVDRLAEISALKDALAQQREEMDRRLAALQKSVEEQIGQQGQQTAAALAADVKLRNLLVRAHGHVLKTRVDWAEGNRGLAREELALAARTLQAAADAAPQERRTVIQELQGLLEQARTGLVLESPTARDHLDLLWHRLSEVLVSE